MSDSIIDSLNDLIGRNVPVVVQHTRLDARLGSLALLTTMAYGEDR